MSTNSRDLVKDMKVVDVKFTTPAQSSFADTIDFSLYLQTQVPLTGKTEWKVIYVGSADDQAFDQVLDEVECDPFQAGTSRIEFNLPPPDIAKIPEDDVLGVTLLLIEGSYDGDLFVRIGYYVNNENPLYTPLSEQETLALSTEQRKDSVETWTDDDDFADLMDEIIGYDAPPARSPSWIPETIPVPKDPGKITRTILIDKARVRIFHIDWEAKWRRTQNA